MTIVTYMARTPALKSCLIAVILTVTACTAVNAQGHESWSKGLGMYEVNVRQYTPEGTLTAFEAHLDRLEELGVGILWFMPLHPIGVQNRLGSLGSYYSVRDYRAVNPEFGSLDDFKRVVAAAHERGMYVIMDWVANHTSWDNVLTTEHPEWYVTDTSGQFIPPPGTNWSDVIELDFTKQALRDYMIASMAYWVDEANVDGFRFDAVSFVPDDFWTEATSALKNAYPDLLLLAESDGTKWHDLGFDMSYAWSLYGFESGVLKGIADGNQNAANLAGFVTVENINYGDGAYRLYFTSNHDENSWHGTTAELFGDAAEVFAVLTGTLGGMPLIYGGQEAGLDIRLPFFDKGLIPWQDHPNATLYQRLLRLKRVNQALWNGDHGGPVRRITTDAPTDVFAFRREKDDHRIVVISNLSDVAKTVTLSGDEFAGSYTEVFSSDVATLGAGSTVAVAPWGYRVFSSVALDTGREGRHDPTVSLVRVYPNPATTTGTAAFTIATAGDVELQVFDLLGRRVESVQGGFRSAGHHELVFDVSKLAPGVYYAAAVTHGGPVAQTRFVVCQVEGRAVICRICL